MNMNMNTSIKLRFEAAMSEVRGAVIIPKESGLCALQVFVLGVDNAAETPAWLPSAGRGQWEQIVARR